MPDDVAQEEKKERLNILQNRLNQLSFGYSRKKVGTAKLIIIEESKAMLCMEKFYVYLIV